MPNVKVNAKVLVAIAFFAAINSNTTVAVLCALAVVFLCKEKSLSASAIDAVLLAMAYSIISTLLGYLTTLAGVLSIGMVTSVVSSVVSVATLLVRIAIIAIAIISALAVLDGREPKIPLLHNIHKDIDNVIVEE